jgi:hypothetical protein
MLDSQASLPGTLAKRSQREEDQVAGNFKTSPIAPEPAMPKTPYIRRCYNQTAGIWAEALSALQQQIDWINGVLNHMIERNYIVLLALRYI